MKVTAIYFMAHEIRGFNQMLTLHRPTLLALLKATDGDENDKYEDKRPEDSAKDYIQHIIGQQQYRPAINTSGTTIQVFTVSIAAIILIIFLLHLSERERITECHRFYKQSVLDAICE